MLVVVTLALTALVLALVAWLALRRRDAVRPPMSEAAAAPPAQVLPAEAHRAAPVPVPTVAEPEPAPVGSAPPPRRPAVLAEAVPAPPAVSGEVEPFRAATRPVLVPPPVPAPRPARHADDALATLDALLAALESATVRIDGADALDETAVAELEGLAERLEEAAASLAPG